MPVPAQVAVAFTFEQAAAAAAQLGYPVVVKPTHGLQTRGVTVGVMSERELKSAVQAAADVQASAGSSSRNLYPVTITGSR